LLISQLAISDIISAQVSLYQYCVQYCIFASPCNRRTSSFMFWIRTFAFKISYEYFHLHHKLETCLYFDKFRDKNKFCLTYQILMLALLYTLKMFAGFCIKFSNELKEIIADSNTGEKRQLTSVSRLFFALPGHLPRTLSWHFLCTAQLHAREIINTSIYVSFTYIRAYDQM